MKFTGLTLTVAVLAGLAAAAPAPVVDGQKVCSSLKGDNFNCPFGQICVLATDADGKSTTGICQSR
ncbi:hypothetical protein Trco_008464 [Trichoderma cornu-damae]|uniref:SSCRP protein n=1 Tax=Trichoderma cornu-damae TaxID=654480 RepID=A0A9P8QFM4_9HYPO|nr:hypothetical protein Trco_008464 [Trichoderma cornu-damae]